MTSNDTRSKTAVDRAIAAAFVALQSDHGLMDDDDCARAFRKLANLASPRTNHDPVDNMFRQLAGLGLFYRECAPWLPLPSIIGHVLSMVPDHS